MIAAPQQFRVEVLQLSGVTARKLSRLDVALDARSNYNPLATAGDLGDIGHFDVGAWLDSAGDRPGPSRELDE